MEVEPRSATILGKLQETKKMTIEKTRSYQEYLIESLKDPSEAALYIWAILQEKNPEPELLSSALQDVSEALGKANLSEKEAKIHLEKLNELKNKQGSDAIYFLSDWLKELNLTLTVIDEQQYYTKNIFMDLAKIRDRKKNTLKTSILQDLAPGKWSKIFFIGFVSFFLLAIISSIFFPPINIANMTKIAVFLGVSVIFILFWSLSLLYFLYLDIKNQKTAKQVREEAIIKTGKEVEIELEEANMISIKYSKKQLEFAIKKFKYFLEEMEGRKKVMSYFTPILSLFLIGWFMYMFGIYPEDIQNALPLFGELGFFGGIGGLSAFLTILLNFLVEASWQPQNTEYKRRLFILEEAKNIAEQREADRAIVINKLIPLKSVPNQNSLMKFAGIFENDPDFEEIISDLKTEREDNVEI